MPISHRKQTVSAAVASIMGSAAARSSTFGNATETVTSASIVLPGDNLSLDYETEMHGDTFADTSDTEEIATDQILMRQLLERLKELMPEAITVGQMCLDEDMSERKCLEQLNLKRSTYRSQLEKARKQLESEFGKFF